MKEIPQEILIKILRYDPETGRLYWRARSPSMFSSGKYSACRSAVIWNGRFAGKEALTSTVSSGYKAGTVLSQDMLAHRVIWAMVKGEYPPEIDHENGKRSDNRIDNLKAAVRLTNGKNQKRRGDNRSGVTGVFWDKRKQRWVAKIKVNYRTVHLGNFVDLSDAERARKDAEPRYGFHPNHGRAA